jgi:hypothetical protein
VPHQRFQRFHLAPGQTAAERLIGRHPQREQVHALVGGGPFNDLGGQVLGGTGAVARFAKLGAKGEGEAEVDELGGAVRGHDYVSGADVAVDVLLLMEIRQGVGDLDEELHAVAVELGVIGLNQAVQAGAVHPFHDQELLAAGGQAVLVGLHNVGMFEFDANLAFGRPFQAGKTGCERLGLFLVEDFQTNHPAELFVLGTEDLRHAAHAALAEDREALLDVNAPAAAEKVFQREGHESSCLEAHPRPWVGCQCSQ